MATDLSSDIAFHHRCVGGQEVERVWECGSFFRVG